MNNSASFSAPKEKLTFGHQISEIILGVQYFASLSQGDKYKVITVLYPLALAFFDQNKLDVNFLIAFTLRNELRAFVHDKMISVSNYEEIPDSRTKTGKNIDNAAIGIRFLLGEYLNIRQPKINPQVETPKKSNFRDDEKQILGMPETVAPIAIALFLLMVLYLVWVYFIKDKKG